MNVRRCAIAVVLASLIAWCGADSVRAEDQRASEVLTHMKERISRLGTFHATAEFEVKTRIMSHWASFNGEGEIWVKSPDLERLETGRLESEGASGGGPPVIRIRRGKKRWMARIIEPSAPPIFKALPDTALCLGCRQPGAPRQGFLRPPFPDLPRFEEIEVVEAHRDTLSGRPVDVLLLRVVEQGSGLSEQIRWWIDTQEIYLVREEWLNADGETTWRYDFSLPKEVEEGVFIPTHIDHYTPEGEQDFSCNLKDLQVGIELEEALFSPDAAHPHN